MHRDGQDLWRSEASDLDELNDELPDDIDDNEHYIVIPDKRDLGLGKPLVLEFAREFLPGDFDEVRYIFSRRGAYAKFRALLIDASSSGTASEIFAGRAQASGRMCGKSMTSRIEGESVKNITRRSIPTPRPAAGGMPYSSART